MLEFIICDDDKNFLVKVDNKETKASCVKLVLLVLVSTRVLQLTQLTKNKNNEKEVKR